MEKYSKYFLLDADTVKEYAKEKVGYFKEEEKLYAAEIGDGNINYVFKVWNPQTGRSLIVKQADTVLRSSGRPLDRYRNKIEAEMLGIESELAEGLVPRIYLYDEIMYAMSMEDISAYKNLRTEMAAGLGGSAPQQAPLEKVSPANENRVVHDGNFAAGRYGGNAASDHGFDSRQGKEEGKGKTVYESGAL